MAVAETTTIRVSVRTRDRLRGLAARRGERAGDVVANLVDAADDDALLVEAAAGFERIAADPVLLTGYREEAADIAAAFDAPAPAW